VTLFPDLRDFNDCIVAKPKPTAQWNVFPVNAFGGYVFGKVSKSDIQTPRLTLFYSFCGKKTHLPFPGARMGVTDDSVIDVQFR
jgi:hypothetical protein